MAIRFLEADRKLVLTGKAGLKTYLKALALAEGAAIEDLSYIFCSDEYLLDINRRFLNHDTYTDIITFDYRNNGKEPIQAEIYISTDRVADNALRFGVAKSEEMHRVIFHGLLHLCGYKDKTTAKKKEMREREDHYLRNYKAK